MSCDCQETRELSWSVIGLSSLFGVELEIPDGQYLMAFSVLPSKFPKLMTFLGWNQLFCALQVHWMYCKCTHYMYIYSVMHKNKGSHLASSWASKAFLLRKTNQTYVQTPM